MRRTAREAVFKALYAFVINKASGQDLILDPLCDCIVEESDYKFAARLFECVAGNFNTLKAEILPLTEFSEERIFKIDLCVLVLAAAEIKYFEDISPITSIDEAAYLSKKYSTENSVNFINGVLAEFLKKNERKKSEDN